MDDESQDDIEEDEELRRIQDTHSGDDEDSLVAEKHGYMSGYSSFFLVSLLKLVNR